MASSGNTAAIEVTGLSQWFGEGEARRQVLFDVSFTIGRGEIVILSGPSGCGKTTILTLVGALRSIQAGSVELLGEELEGAPADALVKARRNIGFIFQAHNLHKSLTASENVRMSLEARKLDDAVGEQRCREMLAAVGLADRTDRFPAQLSGGQRQRVAIARALIGNPAVILADEPTAALDSRAGRDVVDILRRLCSEHGTTVLMVTHDNRVLDIADRILTIEDGRILSERRQAGPGAGRTTG